MMTALGRDRQSARTGVRYRQAALLWLGLPAQADPQQINAIACKAGCKVEAKRLFGERLAIYAEKLGVKLSRVCAVVSGDALGQLFQRRQDSPELAADSLPACRIIDYVVAHELAHLREMNHSPRFWQTVESIFPEFREARHTLKHHPPELLPLL